MIMSYVRISTKESHNVKTLIYNNTSHMSTVTVSVDAIFLKTILITSLHKLLNTIITIFKLLIFMYYITYLILQKVSLGTLQSRENLRQSQFFKSV